MLRNQFPSGPSNPSYKGTYVLNVEANLQYGPFLKANVLIAYNISSKKYYSILNNNIEYKGFMYSHIKWQNVTLVTQSKPEESNS